MEESKKLVQLVQELQMKDLDSFQGCFLAFHPNNKNQFYRMTFKRVSWGIYDVLFDGPTITWRVCASDPNAFSWKGEGNCWKWRPQDLSFALVKGDIDQKALTEMNANVDQLKETIFGGKKNPLKRAVKNLGERVNAWDQEFFDRQVKHLFTAGEFNQKELESYATGLQFEAERINRQCQGPVSSFFADEFFS